MPFPHNSTTSPTIQANNWYFSLDHRQLCRVVEVQRLWGQEICLVWLPRSDSLVRLPSERLQTLAASAMGTAHLSYAAAAGRVADALTQDLLLAPIGSSVIPLPHQIRALSQAMRGDKIRYLLADEVGLGKTIEAGLILRELKLRGLVRRTLIVAPKGLTHQWVAEMAHHFNETFQLVLPEDIYTLSRIGAPEGLDHQSDSTGQNPWTLFSQVVVPMDSVKPMDKRRGWTVQQLQRYNADRFEGISSAGWDLVIVDEAHRLGGSSDQVARYRLGLGLAEAAPYFLLLTATPHQGKTDAFHRLVSLLDEKAFPDLESVTRDRVQSYVIRTEKRRAIDSEGKPLFKPRRTQLVPVSWTKGHQSQKALYEAVTSYVREGYNQAMKEKRNYIGFLMILMQRLVVSSTRAIRATLEKRLEYLEEPEGQMSLFPPDLEEAWMDLDGQEQMETLLNARLMGLRNEREEVRLLLAAAARCERLGPDVKAEALLEWLYQLQVEESDSELKALIFTEFVPTQEMLYDFLTERGFSVVCLNGSLTMEERREVHRKFAGKTRILLSTEAGGEGLNLQFCHVVINYDIPWNPMRLEQRIGRVDRIGQKHVVRALNLVLEGSVEHRVREVLETKLAVIYEEFGIDKTGDVLDSEQAGELFEEMYVEALLNPEEVESSVDKTLAQLQEEATHYQQASAVLGRSEEMDPQEAQRLMHHPLPYWIERMTVSYLEAHGGRAEKGKKSWTLTWPEGTAWEKIVFSSQEAERFPATEYVSLAHSRIRALASSLPRAVPGQPVAIASLPGLSSDIEGLWSLWRIELSREGWNRRRIMPLFLADNGSIYMQTAAHLWDQFVMGDSIAMGIIEKGLDETLWEKAHDAAESQGKVIYETLIQAHRESLMEEKERETHAFAARRRLIESIGLPQVKNYRLKLLAQEEDTFNHELRKREQICPELIPVVFVRVVSSED